LYNLIIISGTTVVRERVEQRVCLMLFCTLEKMSVLHLARLANLLP
jgi:hypothetical protein